MSERHYRTARHDGRQDALARPPEQNDHDIVRRFFECLEERICRRRAEKVDAIEDVNLSGCLDWRKRCV